MLILIFVWLGGGVAATETSIQQLPKNKFLTMCVDHYPPLQVILPDGTTTGENVEIAKIYAKKLGYKLKFTGNVPFKRCLKWLEDGKVDLMAGLLSSPERAKAYHLFLYDDVTVKQFFTHKNSKSIKSFEDLEGLNIGIIRGVKNFERFDLAPYHFFNKVESPTLYSAFGMLQKQRVDAVLCTKYYGEAIIRENPKLQKSIVLSDYSEDKGTPVYIALAKNTLQEKEVSRFQQVAEQMFNSGEFTQIIIDFQKEHPQFYLPTTN